MYTFKAAMFCPSIAWLPMQIKLRAGVAVICVPPWYVYPRTHITSDMCTPGRDTQNTEALYPGLQRLQGKHGGHEGQILLVYTLKFRPIQNINERRSERNWIIYMATWYAKGYCWFEIVFGKCLARRQRLQARDTNITKITVQWYVYPNVSQNICSLLRLWALF